MYHLLNFHDFFLWSIYFDSKEAGVHFRVEKRKGGRYRGKKGKRQGKKRDREGAEKGKSKIRHSDR